MNFSEAASLVRKLAKTNEYQNLYNGTKELHFKLFENNSDFSAIQLQLLLYLNFYSVLYMDIYLGEIDEIVLENEIYEDAYMYHRNKKNKRIFVPKQEAGNKPIDKISQIKSQWNFRRS